MSWVVYSLLGLILLIFFSGGYMFLVACVRRKELPWLVEEEIQKTSYGKYYEFMTFGDQWLKEHHAQDVYIQNRDGLRLHAYWIPADNPKGTIVLAHGYRSTMLADFGIAFEGYHSMGLNLLVPHQRSHGESQGRFITFGVKESGDILEWIDYHNRQFGEHQMILSGMSMGASTMLYLANADLPDNVKGIIADCGFTSPKEILSSVFRQVVRLPAVPTIWAAELFARLFAGFSLYERDTRKTLAESKIPVLMVHGTADDFVPCEMSEQGYAACTAKKRLLLVKGAEHGVSFIVDQESYTRELLWFLKENLEGFV